jgi:hypothetical protein
MSGDVTIPCGGCGATENAKRCIGCLHDFGTPESAWVKKYAAPTPIASPNAPLPGEEGAREAAQAIMDKSSYRIWPADAKQNIAEGLLTFARAYSTPSIEVREALVPFAQWAAWFDRMARSDDDTVHCRIEDGEQVAITLGDLRRARAALVSLQDKGEGASRA